MALQLCLNWTGQAEIKILSEIFEYPSLSNMWGFLTVFQIIWDTRDCAAWGEDHIWLDRLPMPGSRGLLYANANTHTRVPTHPVLWHAPTFRIHKSTNIWIGNQLFTQSTQQSQNSFFVSFLDVFLWPILQSYHWNKLFWCGPSPRMSLKCSSSNFMRAAHLSSASQRLVAIIIAK